MTHYELRTGHNTPIMRFEDELRAREELRKRSPRYNGSIRLVKVRVSVTEEELAA